MFYIIFRLGQTGQLSFKSFMQLIIRLMVFGLIGLIVITFLLTRDDVIYILIGDVMGVAGNLNKNKLLDLALPLLWLSVPTSTDNVGPLNKSNT